MAVVKLSDRLVAHITVKHEKPEKPSKLAGPDKPADPKPDKPADPKPVKPRCRKTNVWLVVRDVYAEAVVLRAEGVSTCAAADNFCRRTGRHTAVRRAMSNIDDQDPDHERLSKDARRKIVTAVCPEFRRKTKAEKAATKV